MTLKQMRKWLSRIKKPVMGELKVLNTPKVSGGELGVNWGVLGVFLGCSWGVLRVFWGCSWDVLGRSGAFIGEFWGFLGMT